MWLKNLFFQHEKCVEVVREFLALLAVKVTVTTIKRDLYHHPDFPSLLSISDILQQYGVENIAFVKTDRELTDIPVPFIVQIMDNRKPDELFAIVGEVRNERVHLFHPGTNNWEWLPLTQFIGRWPSRIALIAEAGEAVGEKDFRAKRRKERHSNILRYISFLFIPLASLTACLQSLITSGTAALGPALFSIFTAAGFVITVLLLWFELDQYNPVLQQICTSNKKTSCGKVLQSRGANIFGTSWSILGFTYFSGASLALLFNGMLNKPNMILLASLSLLAFPYIFYSIYYQWQVARQWCVLCLTVQGILGLQLATILSVVPEVFSIGKTSIPATVLLSFATGYILSFLLASVLMPVFREAKTSKRNAHELQRLKHNTQIFDALLSRQSNIQFTTDGLGITLGNPDAKYKIIKVCNPYCSPCSRAHVPMEELLHSNPEVQIQIIFNASADANDERARPVKHLLAIAEKNPSEAVIKQALDDWYLADNKEYEVFAAKYPMNGELAVQEMKVKAMREWCNNMKIDFTPTFFVNGYKLPDIYTVNDLKYFLSV